MPCYTDYKPTKQRRSHHAKANHQSPPHSDHDNGQFVIAFGQQEAGRLTATREGIEEGIARLLQMGAIKPQIGPVEAASKASAPANAPTAADLALARFRELYPDREFAGFVAIVDAPPRLEFDKRNIVCYNNIYYISSVPAAAETASAEEIFLILMRNNYLTPLYP